MCVCVKKRDIGEVTSQRLNKSDNEFFWPHFNRIGICKYSYSHFISQKINFTFRIVSIHVEIHGFVVTSWPLRKICFLKIQSSFIYLHQKIVSELSKLYCGFILWSDCYIYIYIFIRWWQPHRKKRDDLKNINVIRRNGLLWLKRNKGEP